MQVKHLKARLAQARHSLTLVPSISSIIITVFLPSQVLWSGAGKKVEKTDIVRTLM